MTEDDSPGRAKSDSWLSNVAAFVCFEILATVVCALVCGFGPMYMAFDHDQNRYHDANRELKDLNWAAEHFQTNLYIGAGVGLLGGAWAWRRITRKRDGELL